AQGVLQLKTPKEKASVSEKWNLDIYLWGYLKYKSEDNLKPAIDFDAIENWRKVKGDAIVSQDKNYFSYMIETNNASNSLVIQSTYNAWQKIFLEDQPGFFSIDSKYYVYKSKTELHFLPLGNSESIDLKQILSYKVPNNERDEWLAYQLKNKDVILRH